MEKAVYNRQAFKRITREKKLLKNTSIIHANGFWRKNERN